MVQLSGPPSNDPWRLKRPGYLRRARVHSVFSFQSGGRGKFSYSMARYSRKGFCACSAPQEPRPASASITTARKRIHTLRQNQNNTAVSRVRRWSEDGLEIGSSGDLRGREGVAPQSETRVSPWMFWK